MKAQLKYTLSAIKCPHCGAEYLPGEIYMPGAIIGQPDDIVKDSMGRLLYEDYSTKDKEPNTVEHFTCEYCEKPFIVEATVTYKVKKETPERDFSAQYVSLLD